jgi:hypothetical protein
MTTPEQFHRLRSTQPSRPSSEAYAQMDRMRAASMKENDRALNGERSSSGAVKAATSSAKK